MYIKSRELTLMTGLCDKCNYITDIDFKVQNHSKGIQETYFICEHCLERYTCFVTDARVRDMQQSLRTIGGRRNGRDQLHKEMVKRMDMLKRELIGL